MRENYIDGRGTAGTIHDRAVGEDRGQIRVTKHVALRSIRDGAIEVVRAICILISVIVSGKHCDLAVIGERHDRWPTTKDNDRGQDSAETWLQR